jgi:serine/threonine protein kinase
VRLYFRQLISAIHYCHEVRKLAHRDIKPENMMLDPSGKLVLCDFGVS